MMCDRFLTCGGPMALGRNTVHPYKIVDAATSSSTPTGAIKYFRFSLSSLVASLIITGVVLIAIDSARWVRTPEPITTTQLTVELDIDFYTLNYTQFIHDFRQSVSIALNIPVSNIIIRSLLPGSVIVNFDITALRSIQLAHTFVQQYASPNSTLAQTIAFEGVIIPDYIPTIIESPPPCSENLCDNTTATVSNSSSTGGMFVFAETTNIQDLHIMRNLTLSYAQRTSSCSFAALDSGGTVYDGPTIGCNTDSTVHFTAAVKSDNGLVHSALANSAIVAADSNGKLVPGAVVSTSATANAIPKLDGSANLAANTFIGSFRKSGISATSTAALDASGNLIAGPATTIVGAANSIVKTGSDGGITATGKLIVDGGSNTLQFLANAALQSKLALATDSSGNVIAATSSATPTTANTIVLAGASGLITAGSGGLSTAGGVTAVSVNINSAPLTPAGGQLRIKGVAGYGQVRVYPSLDDQESGISFFRYAEGTTSFPGNVWVVGHRTDFAVDPGFFTIATEGTGAVLKITPAGAVTIPGTLTTTGATTLSSTLSVTTSITAGTGGLSTSGNIITSGEATTLRFSGNAALQSKKVLATDSTGNIIDATYSATPTAVDTIVLSGANGLITAGSGGLSTSGNIAATGSDSTVIFSNTALQNKKALATDTNGLVIAATTSATPSAADTLVLSGASGLITAGSGGFSTSGTVTAASAAINSPPAGPANGGQLSVKGLGSFGTLRVYPNDVDGESGISFWRTPNAVQSLPGDVWVVGHKISTSLLAGEFGIATTGSAGLALAITPAGVLKTALGGHLVGTKPQWTWGSSGPSKYQLIDTGAGIAAEASVYGSDIAGEIRILAKGSPAAGNVITLHFQTSYTTDTPFVVITPVTDNARTLNAIISTTNAGSFTLNLGSAMIPEQMYKWNYIVIG